MTLQSIWTHGHPRRAPLQCKLTVSTAIIDTSHGMTLWSMWTRARCDLAVPCLQLRKGWRLTHVARSCGACGRASLCIAGQPCPTCAGDHAIHTRVGGIMPYLCRSIVPYLRVALLVNRAIPLLARTQVDIYSYGMIMQSMWTRIALSCMSTLCAVLMPYLCLLARSMWTRIALSCMSTLCGCADWDGLFPGKAPSEPAEGWRDLLERCWLQDPQQRPDFTDVTVTMLNMFKANKIAKRAAREKEKEQQQQRQQQGQQ
ncbi:hypothetical protein DUNSADRAFT_15625 [Dunaliella salina]|uniref:Serine-threonine/tyrosine-protein kinase catalytic domain-containing protein n=1 Tax=Dunaliella salina TaxID=3046 RepID=A0ABQ7H1P9_DUNSA|nr:hypothetical protein DUNSADRAFT_15625 [Dunaliella salina]|eukprot:KAF5840767.1 hypothetical protein DUNSADRAFT_15625 [Dunaliella salina]